MRLKLIEMSGHILSAQQELINRLREELSLAETGIQSEIERETDDLGVMRRRMKEHLSATRDSHRAQLQRIDVTAIILSLIKLIIQI